jgi:peptidoglycan/xylan/chitin deacetylase (PgdA/CDA1 family)
MSPSTLTDAVEIGNRSDVRFWIFLIIVVALLIGPLPPANAAQPEPPGNPSSSPQKLVALDFLGPCSNYLTFVAPLLVKHGFKATFYVDDSPGRRAGTLLNAHSLLSWEDVGKLAAMGFEIGNATTDVRDGIEYKSKSQLLDGLYNVGSSRVRKRKR